jgi:hypothetical protein
MDFIHSCILFFISSPPLPVAGVHARNGTEWNGTEQYVLAIRGMTVLYSLLVVLAWNVRDPRHIEREPIDSIRTCQQQHTSEETNRMSNRIWFWF